MIKGLYIHLNHIACLFPLSTWTSHPEPLTLLISIKYVVIYIWQIIEGKVPNIDSPDHAGIKAAWHPCRGQSFAVPGESLHAPKCFQSLRYSNFGVVGSRLFMYFQLIFEIYQDALLRHLRFTLIGFLPLCLMNLKLEDIQL